MTDLTSRKGQEDRPCPNDDSPIPVRPASGQAEDRYRRFFESALDGLLLIDATGVIQEAIRPLAACSASTTSP